MESINEFSIEFIMWLQTTYPQLEPFFQFISDLGKFEIYLALVPLIYWSLHKGIGRTLIYILTLGEFINAFMKHIFRDPRPYWIDPSFGLSSEPSYGFPSGHAQSSTIAFLLLAAFLGMPWFWAFSFLMIFLISFSRIYLGVHDIPDIFGGLFLGLIILLCYWLWKKYVSNRFNNRILGQRLLIALLLPILIGILYLIFRLLLGQPDYDVVWSSFIDEAESIGLKSNLRAMTVLIGFTVGFILEGSRVRFTVSGPIWKRGLRFIIGISLIIIGYFLMGLIPKEPIWLEISLNVVLYILGSFWISFYAPLVFVRFGLAESKPEPETTLTV